MVATVLKLRYRALGNNLARHPWQLVGFCFGALGALWMLGLAVTGFVALLLARDLSLTTVLMTLAGCVLVAGWVLGPVLVAGTDTTVDARSLAPFPLTTRQVMVALAGTGITGIPGLVMVVAALASLLVWVPWAPALLIAVPGVVAGILLCVIASRLVATLSSGLGGNRRGREVIGTVITVVLVLLGPLLSALFFFLGDRSRDVAAAIASVAGILGWAPLGAPWAAAGAAAAGQWLPALAKLAIALASVALLWWAWRLALTRQEASPAQTSARTVAAGALGLFGRMPTGPVGATWARSLTGWLRDPRYARQLLLVPLMPIVFGVVGGADGFLFVVSPLLIAVILAMAGYSDISYDGTAFASVLSTGIRGRDDRLGRVLGVACVSIPLLVAVTLITTAISGTWASLPAMLGAGLGILLGGIGVCAVSSALLVVPVAAPGDSPFKTVPGQTFLSGLAVFVVIAACGVAGLPALVIAIISFVQQSMLLGVVALAVGLIVGGALVVGGVILGGRIFDRQAPSILARIRAFPR